MMLGSGAAAVGSESCSVVTWSDRPRLDDLRSHLTCQLCRGYLIDATSITECLHTFCRSCILNHLEKASSCPTCHIAVLKSKASCSLRLDRTLQRIVYKMIPSLFEAEMARRRQFYHEKPYADPELASWAKGDVTSFVPHIYLPGEYVSIKLQMCRSFGMSSGNPAVRYIRCLAETPLSALHKLISIKLQITGTSTIDVELLHKNTVLSLDLTLMDVGYMHSMSQNETFEIYYRLVQARKRTLPEEDLLAENESDQKRFLPEDPSPDSHTVIEGKLAQKRSSPDSDNVSGTEPAQKRSSEADFVTRYEPAPKRFAGDEFSGVRPIQPISIGKMSKKTDDRSQAKSLMFDADDDEPTSPKVVQDIIDSLEEATDDGVESKTEKMSVQTTMICDSYDGIKAAESSVPSDDIAVDDSEERAEFLIDKLTVKEDNSSKSGDSEIASVNVLPECLSITENSSLEAKETNADDNQEKMVDDTPITSVPIAQPSDETTACSEGPTNKSGTSDEKEEDQVESVVSTSVDSRVSDNREKDCRSVSDSIDTETGGTLSASGWCPDDSDSDNDPSALVVDESDLSSSVNSSDCVGDHKVTTNTKCAEDFHKKTVDDNSECDFQSKTKENKETCSENQVENSEYCNDENDGKFQSKDESGECLIADSPKLPSEGSKADEVRIVRKINNGTDAVSSNECVNSVAQATPASVPSRVDCSVQTSTNDEFKNCHTGSMECVVSTKSLTMTDATTTTDTLCMKDCGAQSSSSNNSISSEMKVSRSSVSTNTNEKTKIDNEVSRKCFNTPSEPIVRSVSDASTPMISQSRSLSFGVRNLIKDFSKANPTAPSQLSTANECTQSVNKIGPISNGSAIKSKNDGRPLVIPEAHSSGAFRTSQKHKNSKYRPLDLSKRVTKPVKSVASANGSSGKDSLNSLQISKLVPESNSGASNRISTIVNTLASRQNITLTPISRSECSKSLPFQKIPTPGVSVNATPSASTTATAAPSQVDLASAYSRLLCPPHALPADVVARVEYDLAMRNLLTLSHMTLSRGQPLPLYMNPGGTPSMSLNPHTPSYLHSSVQPANISIPHSSGSLSLSESLHSTAATQWLQHKHLQHLHQHALNHPHHQLPQMFQQSTSSSASSLPGSATSVGKKSSPLVGCTAPKVRSPPETSSASLRRLEAVGCDKEAADSAFATASYGRKRSAIIPRCVEK